MKNSREKGLLPKTREALCAVNPQFHVSHFSLFPISPLTTNKKREEAVNLTDVGNQEPTESAFWFEMLLQKVRYSFSSH